MPKKQSHYPVQRGAHLTVSGTSNDTIKLLDVGQELSKLNRRLYRQGRYYNVAITMDSDGSDKNYTVYALRDDWMVQKGYMHALQAYMDVTADERENMSKAQVARWEDFRVAAGVTNDPVFATQYDQNANPFLLALGEHALSTVVDDAGGSRTFSWFPTGSATTYSILEEYDKAGNAQASPESLVPGSAGPYAGLTPGNDGATYTNLESKGDVPPYDQDGVNAATPWTRVGVLRSGTGGEQRLSTGFFTAPCGLVLIVPNSASDTMGNVAFETKAGNYKGVHALPMAEMSKINRKRTVVK